MQNFTNILNLCLFWKIKKLSILNPLCTTIPTYNECYKNSSRCLIYKTHKSWIRQYLKKINEKQPFKFQPVKEQNTLLTPSLISPSFLGGPTIFHKGNFLKHTPFTKKGITYKGVIMVGLIAIPRLRLMLSNVQPNGGKLKLNRVKTDKKEREHGRGGGRGTHNVPQCIAAIQMLKCMA